MHTYIQGHTCIHTCIHTYRETPNKGTFVRLQTPKHKIMNTPHIQTLLHDAERGLTDTAAVHFLLDDGSIMHLHRNILAGVSPMFRAFFHASNTSKQDVPNLAGTQTPLKRFQTSPNGTLILNGCKRETFAALREYIYTGNVRPERMLSADARQLWKFAHALDIHGLKEWLHNNDVCLDVNGQTTSPAHVSADYGLVVLQHEDYDLAEAGLRMLARRVADLNATHLRNVPAPVVKRVVTWGTPNAEPIAPRRLDDVSKLKFLITWRMANRNASWLTNKTMTDLMLASQIDLAGVPIMLLESANSVGLVNSDTVAAHLSSRLAKSLYKGAQWTRDSAHVSELARFSAHGTQTMTMTTMLTGPRRIATFSDGGFVVVCGINRVNVFTPSGRYTHTLGTTTAGTSMFSFPWGVAVAGNQHVVVSDFAANSLFVFQRDGTLVRVIRTTSIDQHTAFFNPYGIAANLAGNIIACDHVKMLTCIYNINGGEHIGTFAPPKFQTTEDHDTSMYAGASPIDGTFIVVQAFKDATQRAVMHVLSSGGVHVRSVELQHTEHMLVVADVAVGSFGEVFVADEHGDCIWVFTMYGELVMKILGTAHARRSDARDAVQRTRREHGKYECVLMGNPRGIAVTADNKIMVSDFDNNCVLILSPTAAAQAQT
jgi:hypothetical protein